MKNQYISYDEGNNLLKGYVEKYPELIDLKSIGKTHEGRDIVIVTLSMNVKKEKVKPALLFTGTIHAREWIGHELALKFIEYILDNYDINPKITEYLSRSTLYIVPCLNPDGYEYSRKHFSFWRKNRRKNSDGSYGVDLNRNFSIGFKKVASMSSNIYGGEKPFSEPETMAIKEFVDEHPNITIALDYHSQGNVFFPAHKFRHENEIDGSDLNILCANMNDQINRVTGRKYGIHRGKPPAKLISGSGREYYYSKGIIAVVVEVGTKNIPDYMKIMSTSVNENIPALLKAYEETINYSSQAPKRVDEFTIVGTNEDSVELSWKYELRDDIYFEIYRNSKDKESCGEHNIMGITKEQTFKDVELESASTYYYTIRAVNKNTKLKSPYAPIVKLKTKLKRDEWFKTLYATKDGTGYVGENMSEVNRSHFGNNSLFIGVDRSKGICDGVVSYDLSSLPKDAIIKTVKFHIYPMNRVAAKIERYGEWNLSILDSTEIDDATDFEQIEEADSIQVVGEAIKSQNLTQGIWNSWDFSSYQCSIVEKQLEQNKIIFRIDGPKELPSGEDSQMMQFDIGHGNFGGGLHYRPYLEVKYTLPMEKIEVLPSRFQSVCMKKNSIQLQSGYDDETNKVYAHLQYDLSSLPDVETTVITNACIELENQTTYKKSKGISFYLELLNSESKISTYEDIKNREKIEYIGYELQDSCLSIKKRHCFVFDTLSKLSLEQFHFDGKKLELVINATTSHEDVKNRIIKWKPQPKLIIEYVKRRKKPLDRVENLKYSIENKTIKLNWSNPKDKDFVGSYVVRNSFHPPKNFLDGVKIYGGKDEYTYDKFGSLDKDKYYSVFTYDDVPNFSDPKVLHVVFL